MGRISTEVNVDCPPGHGSEVEQPFEFAAPNRAVDQDGRQHKCGIGNPIDNPDP